MPRCSLRSLLGAALAFAACGSFAQTLPDPADWKETEAAPPPVFDAVRAIPFEGPVYSGLKFALDPATITIGADGVVRYVVVMTSNAGGAVNAMYEGIRCSTGEFKTYARFSGGNWKPVARAEWTSVFDNMPSKHPLRLAKQGVCTNAAPASSVAAIVQELKNPRFSP